MTPTVTSDARDQFGGPTNQIVVVVDDAQSTHVLDHERWSCLLSSSLAAQAIDGPAEVGLLFVDRPAMTELNVEHMGATGATDVLSFPIDGAGPVAAGAAIDANAPLRLIGDIVICPAVVAESDCEFDDEMALMIVHGALHLVGHDHREPDETRVMKQLEASLLASFYQRPLEQDEQIQPGRTGPEAW